MPSLDSGDRIIRVAVVGLRGHAGRHIQLLLENPACELVAVYYPGRVRDDTDLPVTDDFGRCLDSDAVIISSPTAVHTSQLLQLGTYPGYVLLEKPAASTEEDITRLLNLPGDMKERVRINYNFPFHAAARRFIELAGSETLGDIFALSILSSHGGVFREDWLNSWRRSEKSTFGPLETVGVHFIQFVTQVLGTPTRALLARSSMAPGPPDFTDTGLLTMVTEKGAWASIQCSYAAPYAFRMELRGTNGYAEYDGQAIRVYSPRSTFDGRGRFTFPPIVSDISVDHDSAWDRSIGDSQLSFLDVVQRNGRFDADDFDRDVSVMNVLLETAQDP